jgi:hypothetical protein
MTGETKAKKFSRHLGKEYLSDERIIPMLKNVLNGIEPTTSLTFISSN